MVRKQKHFEVFDNLQCCSWGESHWSINWPASTLIVIKCLQSLLLHILIKWWNMLTNHKSSKLSTCCTDSCPSACETNTVYSYKLNRSFTAALHSEKHLHNVPSELQCNLYIRVSNWVWIYTRAALMERAGEWVRGATDCVYTYIMWKEDLYREVWEGNYKSNSFMFHLMFRQQMFC